VFLRPLHCTAHTWNLSHPDHVQCHTVKMATRTFRVSHTSRRLVWTWLLTQPIHLPLSPIAADM
jgi:hypothetical protein